MFDSTKYRNNEDFDDREAYFNREAAIKREMREDLEDEFGTFDDPRADEMWEKAWNAGYPPGAYDVYEAYSEQTELMIL